VLAVIAFLRESARSLFLIIAAAAESQASAQATIHPRSIHAPLRDPLGQDPTAAL